MLGDMQEYRDFFIMHIKNDGCHDYEDIPERGDGWRVLRLSAGINLICATLSSEAEAKNWVDKYYVRPIINPT